MDSDKTLSDLTFRQQLGLFAIVALAVTAKVMPYAIYRFGWNLDPTEFGSYVWNFSPLLPLALVAGSSLSARWAYGIPLLAWFLGDLGIWAVSGHFEWAFYPHQMLIYELAAGIVFLGVFGRSLMRSESWLERTSVNLGMGLIGATLFFVISNFMIWAVGSEMLYTKTWGGLVECFVAAIPFYRCSLGSMILFVPVLTALMPAPSRDTVSTEDRVPNFAHGSTASTE